MYYSVFRGKLSQKPVCVCVCVCRWEVGPLKSSLNHLSRSGRVIPLVVHEPGAFLVRNQATQSLSQRPTSEVFPAMGLVLF